MSIYAASGYRSAIAQTVSDTVAFPETNAVAVVATVAGNVSLKVVGGQTIIVPVLVGLTILPLAAIQINTTGTTATATYYRLN